MGVKLLHLWRQDKWHNSVEGEMSLMMSNCSNWPALKFWKGVCLQSQVQLQSHSCCPLSREVTHSLAHCLGHGCCPLSRGTVHSPVHWFWQTGFQSSKLIDISLRFQKMYWVRKLPKLIWSSQVWQLLSGIPWILDLECWYQPGLHTKDCFKKIGIGK